MYLFIFILFFQFAIEIDEALDKLAAVQFLPIVKADESTGTLVYELFKKYNNKQFICLFQ